jgi:capsule polysaccharide export protein KpsE/RkpR
MSEKAPLMSHDESTREDIILTKTAVETTPNGNHDHEFAWERSVATQRLVWKNRQFIFRSTVAGLLFSILIAFLIPKRFESTTRLMPPDEGSSGLAMLAAASSSGLGATLGSSGLGSSLAGSGLGAMAGDLLGLKNSSELFIGVLQSRTVQDDLINKFNLRKVYWDRRMEDAREDLDKHTDLSTDRKSGIITIQVEDKSPERAAAMAGEYVSELNRVVIQLNTSAAHRERVFLEDRLVQVKQDLESAELHFSEFARKNTALDIPTQGKAMIESVATLQGELIATQTELESLKQIYADGNVRVRATQARVAELRRELSRNLGSKSNELGSADGQNQDTPFPSIRDLPSLGVGYADLYRNTRVQEAIFQALTQQYELARVQEAKETPSIKVLDPPDVPGKKSFPPRLLLITLGTLLAMITGMVWVLGKQRWNDVEPRDPQKLFAQEVIHTIGARLPWVATNGLASDSAGTDDSSQSRRNGNQEGSHPQSAVSD